MRVEILLKYDFNNSSRSFIWHSCEQSKFFKKCDGPSKNGPIHNRIGNTTIKIYKNHENVFHCNMKQMRVGILLKYDFNNSSRSFIWHFCEQRKFLKKCDGSSRNGPISNRIGNTNITNYILK